jgi:hypothetical protein
VLGGQFLDGLDVAAGDRDQQHQQRSQIGHRQEQPFGYPPARGQRQVHRPRVVGNHAGDWPDTAPVVADLPRIQAILERIATDVDELARARRVEEFDIAAVRPDRRVEQRRRAAEDDLDFRQFGTRNNLAMSSTLQLERAWDAWQAERHRRGEIDQRPGYSDNPFRPH